MILDDVDLGLERMKKGILNSENLNLKCETTAEGCESSESKHLVLGYQKTYGSDGKWNGAYEKMRLKDFPIMLGNAIANKQNQIDQSRKDSKLKKRWESELYVVRIRTT